MYLGNYSLNFIKPLKPCKKQVVALTASLCWLEVGPVSGFVCPSWLSSATIPIQLGAPSPTASLCVLRSFTGTAELLLHSCYAASQKLECSLRQKSLLKPLKMAAEWLKKDRNPSRGGTVSPQFPSTCGNDKSRLLQRDRTTQPMSKSSRDFLL